MKQTFSKIALVALIVALSACTPTIANRGNMVDPDKLAEIKVGETTREQVVSTLGSPTQVGTFDENVWYYFGRSTEQYSFLDPKVVKQQALEVHFNEEGVVTAVNQLDPNEAQNISPVARRTPTYGHETTWIEQLVGNLGRPGGLGGRESKK